MALAWYLLHTKARQERRALEHLQRQGFTCYLPEVCEERLRQGKRTVQTVPLFPGYLFIELADAGQSWGPIRSTRGVLRLVCFGQHAPKALPEGLVETLRIRTVMSRAEPVPECLHPGDRVSVTEGPFAGLDAVFACHDGDERAVILLRWMEREQRLSVPVAAVERR